MCVRIMCRVNNYVFPSAAAARGTRFSDRSGGRGKIRCCKRDVTEFDIFYYSYRTLGASPSRLEKLSFSKILFKIESAPK